MMQKLPFDNNSWLDDIPSHQKFYVIRQCHQLEAPALFLSRKDCDWYYSKQDNNSTSTFQQEQQQDQMTKNIQEFEDLKEALQFLIESIRSIGSSCSTTKKNENSTTTKTVEQRVITIDNKQEMTQNQNKRSSSEGEGEIVHKRPRITTTTNNSPDIVPVAATGVATQVAGSTNSSRVEKDLPVAPGINPKPNTACSPKAQPNDPPATMPQRATIMAAVSAAAASLVNATIRPIEKAIEAAAQKPPPPITQPNVPPTAATTPQTATTTTTTATTPNSTKMTTVDPAVASLVEKACPGATVRPIENTTEAAARKHPPATAIVPPTIKPTSTSHATTTTPNDSNAQSPLQNLNGPPGTTTTTKTATATATATATTATSTTHPYVPYPPTPPMMTMFPSYMPMNTNNNFYPMHNMMGGNNNNSFYNMWGTMPYPTNFGPPWTMTPQPPPVLNATTTTTANEQPPTTRDTPPTTASPKSVTVATADRNTPHTTTTTTTTTTPVGNSHTAASEAQPASSPTQNHALGVSTAANGTPTAPTGRSVTTASRKTVPTGTSTTTPTPTPTTTAVPTVAPHHGYYPMYPYPPPTGVPMAPPLPPPQPAAAVEQVCRDAIHRATLMRAIAHKRWELEHGVVPPMAPPPPPAASVETGYHFNPPPPRVRVPEPELTPEERKRRMRQRHEVMFERHFEQLKEFKEEYGDCDIPYKKGVYEVTVEVTNCDSDDDDDDGGEDHQQPPDTNNIDGQPKTITKIIDFDDYWGLNKWVADMRKQMQIYEISPTNSELYPEEYEKLKSIDFCMEPKRGLGPKVKPPKPIILWNEDRFEDLKRFYDQHGHSKVPTNKKEYRKLKEWLYRMQAAYRDKQNGRPSTITQEHISRLEEYEFQIDNIRSPTTFDERVVQWLAYRAQHEGKDPIFTKEDTNPIAAWVIGLRTSRRKRNAGGKTTLTQERIDKLDKFGFDWKGCDVIASKKKKGGSKKFHERLEELVAYKAKYGHCLVPQAYPSGLGGWVSDQRYNYGRYIAGKRSTMTAERAEKLREVEFVFEQQVGGVHRQRAIQNDMPTALTVREFGKVRKEFYANGGTGDVTVAAIGAARRRPPSSDGSSTSTDDDDDDDDEDDGDNVEAEAVEQEEHNEPEREGAKDLDGFTLGL